MNTLPKPIIDKIYRYIHKDTISQAHKEMLPITRDSTPFSMFHFNTDDPISFYRKFNSNKCKMCDPEDAFKCCFILGIMDGRHHSFINGKCYAAQTHFQDNILRVTLTSAPAQINCSKGCLFKQLFDFHKICKCRLHQINNNTYIYICFTHIYNDYVHKTYYRYFPKMIYFQVKQHKQS